MKLIKEYNEHTSNKKHFDDVKNIVFQIVEDMSGRRGLGQEWDQIDNEIKEEIFEQWINIANETIQTTQRQERIHNEIVAVKDLGEKIGYGHLMVLASALWREKLKPQGIESGAFIPTIINFIKDDKEIKNMTEMDIKHYDKIIQDNG